MFKINQKIKQQILKLLVILLLSTIISEIIVLIINIIYPKIIGTPSFEYIFCIHRGVTDQYFFNIKKIFLILSLIFSILTAIIHFTVKQKNNKYIFLFVAIFMSIYSIIPPINFNFAYSPSRIIIFVIILALTITSYFLYKKIQQENILISKTDSCEILKEINIKKYFNRFAILTIFFLLLSVWSRIALEQFDNLHTYILNCCILAFLFILLFIFFHVKFKKIILVGVIFSIFNILETIYINLSQKTNYFAQLNYYEMVNIQLIVIAIISFILLFTIIKNSKIKFEKTFKKFFISHFFAYLLFGLLLCAYAVLDGGRNPDMLLVGFLAGMFFIKENKFINFAIMAIIYVMIYHFIFSGIISLLILSQHLFSPFNGYLCILNSALEFSYLFPMLLGLFFSFVSKHSVAKYIKQESNSL